MSSSFQLDAELRTDKGKGASRRLRRADMVPAILYGGTAEPVSLQLKHQEFMHQLENEAFYAHILTINVDGQSHSAVLKDLQRHPAKSVIMHADFLRVSKTEKLTMHVPLHFIGAEGCPGVKTEGGRPAHQLNDVEVSCLAADLPEFIEVDMSAMNIGDSIHLSDLALPSGVESVALSHGEDHDLQVASVVAPKAIIEEEVAAPEAEAEGGEESSEEGDDSE